MKIAMIICFGISGIPAVAVGLVVLEWVIYLQRVMFQTIPRNDPFLCRPP